MEEMEHLPQRWPNVSVPPGYRFKPTPRELIQYYLEPWVATVNNEPRQQSPGEFYGIMAAADVYGEDPTTLASRFQHIAHDDGNWYFLSVARWKDGNRRSKRMSRGVGGGGGDGHLGTWHGSSKQIHLRGVGYRQGFEFRPADGSRVTWLMEEFSTVLDDAKDDVGARVLCRLHLTPKAAAAAAADGGYHQQQQHVANDDVPAAPPCNKRQRQRAAPAPACQQVVVEHHFDNASSNWTAAPDVGFSSYAIATTVAAPATPPPDVGCFSSYAIATTSSHAAAPVTELTAEALVNWQHQPMMEQPGDEGYHYQYHCNASDVHGGGVHIRDDDEPQPLEMVTTDVGFTTQDLKMEDSDLMFTMEQLMESDDRWIMDCNNSSANLSFLEPRDGVQENNDPKPETSDGVQLQENNEPKQEPSDGVQEEDDDPKGGTDAS